MASKIVDSNDIQSYMLLNDDRMNRYWISNRWLTIDMVVMYWIDLYIIVYGIDKNSKIYLDRNIVFVYVQHSVIEVYVMIIEYWMYC